MFAKLSACACAALLVSGGVALAQPSHDERQDRSASLRDDREIRDLSAQLKRDDAKVDELLHRAGHEQGEKRDADVAEAQRYKAQAQVERDKIKALNANNKATMKDYHTDSNDKPH